MKKSYRIEDLDCACCATKMEDAIRRLDGVTGAQINFLTQKLTIEAADANFDAVVRQAAKLCRSIEPNCRVVF